VLILQQHQSHADEPFVFLKASKLSHDFCIEEELIMPVCLASLFLRSFRGSHSISHLSQPSRSNIISTMSMLSSLSAPGGGLPPSQHQHRHRPIPTALSLHLDSHSIVPPFAFFVGSFKFAVSAACEMVVWFVSMRRENIRFGVVLAADLSCFSLIS
jgi:hypothetical protein